MAKDNMTFQLDVDVAQVILTEMAMPLVRSSANAIASRAKNMAASLSSEPIDMVLSSRVGTIRRGTRAIATVTAQGNNPHANYIGRMALTKSKDAGRV